MSPFNCYWVLCPHGSISTASPRSWMVAGAEDRSAGAAGFFEGVSKGLSAYLPVLP